MATLERSVAVLQKTDFSIERLLRKDPPSIITIDIKEDGQRVGVEALSHHSLTAESDRSQLQFHSDPESQMTNNADEEGEKDEESRYLLAHKNMGSTFSWLTCTRFKPPKLPRSKKRAGCKRYGRGPRIPFAPHQIAVLESTFSKSQYLSSDCIHRLADTLHLSETRVKIWFQNRRARYRREKEVPGLAHHQMSRHPGNMAMTMEPYQAISPATSPSRSPTSPSSIPRDSNSGSKTNYHPNYLQSDEHYPEDPNSPSNRKLLIPDLISFQIQQHRHAQQLQHYFYQQQRLSNSLLSSTSRSSRHSLLPSSQQPTSILHSALQASPPQAHAYNTTGPLESFSRSTSGNNAYCSERVNEAQNSVPVSSMSSSQISRLISLNSALASMPLGLSFQ